jgi:hypothetical protein
MAYKRYFYKKGKRFGPYYYQSYRDSTGKVRKKYIGTINPDEEKKHPAITSTQKIITPTRKFAVLGILLLVLLFVLVMFSYSQNSTLSISDTGKILSAIREKAINPVSKLVGLTIDEPTEIVDETKGMSAQEEPADEGENRAEESVEETFEEPAQEEPAETEQEETTQGEAQEANETQEVDQENETEVAENITEFNETQTPQENVTKNITETPLTDSNLTQLNITGPNITESNFTINETILNNTEENITIINETEINVTGINETISSELNITIIQYKAVIGKPVRWLKSVTVDTALAKEQEIDLVLELPKDAQNITVKTGEEAKEAKKDAKNSEEGQERKMGLTGQVIIEDEEKGILTKIWEFLTGLSITGNVIDESEVIDSITEKEDKLELDLQQIVDEETKEETEIAVEYETPAPQAEEEAISRGKKVVVSADDSFNYTDILAYTQLDNRISINDSNKIKVYWVKDEIQQGIVEKAAEEANETIEKTGEIVEEVTAEEIIENESAGNETIAEINETLSILTGQAISEEEKEEELINSTNGTKEEITEEIKEQETQTSVIREEVNFTAFDLDLDGKIDYIEWNVEHLSNQTYEIIYVTKAEHYDSNYTFIEDAYESVKALDGNYTTIPDSHVLRVTFEQALDKTKDITIFARAGCNGSAMINGIQVPCEIFEKKKRIDEIKKLLGGEV